MNCLSNNNVYRVVTTSQGEVYLATFGGGLNQLVSMNGEGGAVFKSYTVKNGLPSDILLSVEEDDTGSLWISTENGLSKFIPSEQRFENYNERVPAPFCLVPVVACFILNQSILRRVIMYHPLF